MLSKSIRNILTVWIIAGLFFASSCSPTSQTQVSTLQKNVGNITLPFVTGSIYSQPVDPNGKLLLSAWLDPDGSNADQYIWDNFTIQSNETITDIEWYGVYDPLKFGAGKPVVDFSVSIYPSIPAGTEPAVANPPLVQYQTGGNAGETQIGTFGTAPLYLYSFTLPTPFAASAGVKYWLQIEASQNGTVPDWCFAPGSDGDANHFQRGAGAGGDIMYRTAPGDAAFTLLGPVPDVPTPTDTPTSTPTDTQTPTETSTPTDTPTNTPTSTSISTPTDTATATLTNTPTDTPTDTPTSSPTYTPTSTPTETPNSAPIHTPTSTPTPLTSTPGKVTGGGVIDLGKGGDQITFGLIVDFNLSDDAPKGNFTYQDHQANLRLKASSFDLLVIEGNHVLVTGTGMLNNEQVVSFKVHIDTVSEPGSQATFTISIPALNGYTAGGAMTGGNITIH